MSGRSNAQRLRLGLTVLFIAAAALGSYWLLEATRQRGSGQLVAIPKDEPDYIVDKFNFVRMSERGEARYNVSGTRMSHFPADDSIEISEPVLHNLSNAQALITLSAQRAVVEQGSKRIHLFTQVKVDRAASASSQDFHLSTDYLLVLPDEDIMQSDQAVTILHGRSRMTAIGMLVNNAKREIYLSDQVRGTIAPPGSIVVSE